MRHLGLLLMVLCLDDATSDRYQRTVAIETETEMEARSRVLQQLLLLVVLLRVRRHRSGRRCRRCHGCRGRREGNYFDRFDFNLEPLRRRFVRSAVLEHTIRMIIR
uniref:Putative secreted protein n=1 Tax=Anopheles triannulatus TaxID=58253 RepID=A0A2M4B2C8_9DIPT